MHTDVVATANVDSEIAQQASEILAESGLTVSDALRLLLEQTVQEQAIPFYRAHMPNAETIEAIEEARKGELIHVGTLEDFMAELNADDSSGYPLFVAI